MEKLAYLLWNADTPSSGNRNAYRDRLLAGLPNALARSGATRLGISVTDAAVEAGEKLHLGRLVPHALVTFWLDCAGDRRPIEAILDAHSETMAGYLVVESQPVLSKAEPGGSATRMPGFSLVGCIEPAAGLSHEDFIDHWENVHLRVAIETQSSVAYTRNEIVRPLTPAAPALGGIVEERFPIEALCDPRVFYDAVDSEERFRENSKRMIESCLAFISVDRVDSHPMSEYRFD